VVGFYEYTNALQNFESLVQSATPEELEVIEAIIAKRDELEIATNLSAKIPHPPHLFDEVANDPNERFVRRGLAWLMALARVEVAATTAGFTPQKRPFEFVGATDFELSAYREMVLDGLRTHYWALQNDSDLPTVRKGRVGMHTLIVYGRRLFLAREMVTAVRLAALDPTPEQLQELNQWDETLSGIQSDIVFELTEDLRRAPITDFAHLKCPSLAEAVQLGLTSAPRPPTANAPTAPSLSTSPSTRLNGTPTATETSPTGP
jgi:hypothetical protein